MAIELKDIEFREHMSLQQSYEFMLLVQESIIFIDSDRSK